MTTFFSNITAFGRTLKTTWLFYWNGLRFYRRHSLHLLALVVGVSMVDFMCPLFTRRLIDIAIPARDIRLWAGYAAVIAGTVAMSCLLNVLIVKNSVTLCEEIKIGRAHV